MLCLHLFGGHAQLPGIVSVSCVACRDLKGENMLLNNPAMLLPGQHPATPTNMHNQYPWDLIVVVGDPGKSYDEGLQHQAPDWSG